MLNHLIKTGMAGIRWLTGITGDPVGLVEFLDRPVLLIIVFDSRFIRRSQGCLLEIIPIGILSSDAVQSNSG